MNGINTISNTLNSLNCKKELIFSHVKHMFNVNYKICLFQPLSGQIKHLESINADPNFAIHVLLIYVDDLEL